MAWQVQAVRYAGLRSTKREMYLRWDSYGEADGEQGLDYFFWILRDGDHTVAVDTGFSPSVGVRRGRTMHVAPADALAAIGVTGAGVGTVVLTHLHWDHIGNVDLFPSARILAPGAELDFWTTPLARREQLRQHIEPDEITELLRLEAIGRLERFHGDCQLLPGVTAIALPGHSPGQHGLLIETGGKPVLLTSDAVHFYEELAWDRPFSILTDLPQTYGSYDRIRTLVAEHDATLLVGHDPVVAERFGRAAGANAGVSCWIA